VEPAVERDQVHARAGYRPARGGAGISPEFLPFVFDRFRQGESGSRRRYGGLGLGLAIVRHLVELHGGTVSVASDGEGKGATFSVSLPDRAPQARAAIQAPGASEALVGSAERLDGVRVLVVDDERDARDLFVSILESAGATVASATSAAEALPILESQPIDVLLSDIEMPGEDGYQLLARTSVTRVPGAPRPIAIAVTAHTRAADRRRALDAGFQWHLPKPVEPTVLVSTIASLLSRA
jgi:CheY-like chemotaxis protein